MYADTLRSAIVRTAARFNTKNNIAPKEIKDLKGSWLRMSRLTATPSELLVPGPGDRVYKAHDRHDVRQIMTGNYLLQELHVYGARGPVADPVRRIRAVGDDVYNVLAPRRLCPAEAVPLRRPYTAAQVRHNLTLGQILKDLLYHPDALLHLADPDPVRGLDVTSLVSDYVEVEVLVPAVRVIAAHVVAHPGTPQGRPREAHLDSLLLRHLADAPRAGDKDLVPLYKVHEVRLEALLKALYVLPHLLGHTLREVGLHAPDADVVKHHPRPGDSLEHVLYTLPLPEGIQDRGERTKLQQEEAYGGDMAHDAPELVQQGAYSVGAGGYLRVQKVLDRHAIAILHGDVVHVVYTVRNRDDRRVHAVLGDLLLAPVQVAHHGVAPHHGLAIELEDQAQKPVHRGMLGAHVHL